MGFWVEVGLASFAESNDAQLDLARRIVASGVVPQVRHVGHDSLVVLRRGPDGAVAKETLPGSALAQVRAELRETGVDTPYDLLQTLEFTDVLVPDFVPDAPLEVEDGSGGCVEIGDLEAFEVECELSFAAYADAEEALVAEGKSERKHMLHLLARLTHLAQLARRHQLPLSFRD